MDEYIKREAAINRIKEYASDVYGIDLDDAKQFSGDSLAENYCEGLYEATELVDDIPAVDVAPVVHARWEQNADSDWYCTNCREVVAICDAGRERTYRKPYCPNCGAKMDGGDSNEVD